MDPDLPRTVRYRLAPPVETANRRAAPPQDARDFSLALLRQHVAWFVRLRFGVAAALVVIGLAAWAGWFARIGVDLGARWPWLMAAGLGFFNAAASRHARQSGRSDHALRANLAAQIAVDLAAVTWLVHEVGSVGTPAPFLYLLHVVLACVFFPIASSAAVLVAAVVLYVACVGMETAGVLPVRWLFGDAAPLRALWPETIFVGWTVGIWAGVWYLASRLGRLIRRRDHEIAEAYRQVRRTFRANREHMFQTAHQFKSPLAAIQTAVAMHRYQHPENGTLCAPVFETIDARCELLRKLVGEILLLARLREGQQVEAARRPVGLDEILHAVIESLQPVAASRGIRIVTRLDALETTGDAEILARMFENLVSNAINYSRDGGSVDIACSAASRRVEVRDHGIGIPPDVLPRIFDDYYRGPDAKRHCRHSTGVGLSIVREAAGMHGMAIDVESAPGAGTAFILHVPAVSNGA